MADIFFSYATEDRARVGPLIDLLQGEGWSVWWDRNLVAGPSFEEAIEAELDSARCLVVAWSNHSVQSRWCRAEATEGLERGILVPLRLDDVRLPLTFRASHTASLLGWPDSQGDLESLLSGIRNLLQVSVSTPAPQRKASSEIRVGDWQVDSEEMTVSDGIAVVPLTRLSWSVLMHLILNRDRLVETQELLQRFWRGDLSNTSAVRKAIHEIRQALGDDPKVPRYIKTVAKKGYLLVADVDTGDAMAGHAIAVLPFLSMSNEPQDAYLNDGIAEEIIAELAQRVSIPVIARSTSFQFREMHQDTRYVGMRIGATHIVEGSVRRSGDHFRVTAQLVAADSGLMLWSGKYDRTMGDLIRLQDEVAREVAAALQSQLGYQPRTEPRHHAPKPTVNRKAVDAYLRGNALLQSGNPFNLPEAIEQFRKATEADRGYAAGWVGLACAYLMQAEESVSTARLSDVVRQADASIQEALNIEPDNGRALGLRAWIMICARYQFEKGLALFEQALAAAPNDALTTYHYAFVLNCLGDERAEGMFVRAHKLDPLNATQIFSYAIFRLFRGEQTEAVRLVESLVSDEQHSYVAHLQVGLLNAFVGRFQVARHHLNRARAIVGADFPSNKVLEYYVELNKDIANPELLNRQLEAIEQVSRSRATPMLVTMGWSAQQIETIWRRAIEARQPTIVMYACTAKPGLMSDAFWDEVQAIVGVQQYLRQAAQYLRPAVDRAELVASQLTLSRDALAQYVGDYGNSDGGMPTTVERRGQELWITFHDTGDYHQLIATAADHFEFYGFYRHLAFLRKPNQINGFTDVSEHGSAEYLRIPGG